MKHFVSVLLFQKLLQIITEADYRVRSFSRPGIGEGFLRMGMIDQNLRAFGIFRQGQVFSEQGAAVDLARQDRSVGIDNEEAVQERLLVSKKVRGNCLLNRVGLRVENLTRCAAGFDGLLRDRLRRFGFCRCWCGASSGQR